MIQISTNKCVKICEEPCNPVFLAWKNSAGGWSYWMFEYRQEIHDITTKGDIFERYVTDLQNATGTFDSLQRFSDRRITIQASHITVSEYDSIKEINSSPKIYQMFKLFDNEGNPINRNQDGTPKRIELLSVSTENLFSTRAKRINAIFTLQYPRIFTQNLI